MGVKAESLRTTADIKAIVVGQRGVGASCQWSVRESFPGNVSDRRGAETSIEGQHEVKYSISLTVPFCVNNKSTIK